MDLSSADGLRCHGHDWILFVCQLSDESKWDTGLSSPNRLPGLVHKEVITGFPRGGRVEALRPPEGLEHVHYCFCHILMVKTSHKASPDSRSGERDSFPNEKVCAILRPCLPSIKHGLPHSLPPWIMSSSQKSWIKNRTSMVKNKTKIKKTTETKLPQRQNSVSF